MYACTISEKEREWVGKKEIYRLNSLLFLLIFAMHLTCFSGTKEPLRFVFNSRVAVIPAEDAIWMKYLYEHEVISI